MFVKIMLGGYRGGEPAETTLGAFQLIDGVTKILGDKFRGEWVTEIRPVAVRKLVRLSGLDDSPCTAR